MTRRKAAAALLLFALLSPHAVALRAQQAAPPLTATSRPAQTQPQPSNDPIERIKDEGLNRSQVMQTLQYLTDVVGPRLTGSPSLKRANEWTRDRLTQWGLQNGRLEPWGPFGRGWTLKRFSAEAVEPQAFPLLAYPRAWSPGLDAPLTADLVIVDAKTEEELQKYKGQLAGKIVLAGTERQPRPLFEPKASRLNEKELLELADAPDPALLPRRTRRPQTPEQLAAQRLEDRKTQFYYDEGVALLVGSSPSGDGGMLQFVQSASVPQPSDTPFDKRKNPWDKDAPKLIPQISLSNDHYNRLARMLRQGEKVRLAVNLQVEFDDTDPMSYNTLAEIPGTDLKDEVVMLGAHLDSWHTATGATDNAAGVSIMMEAVRILKALNLRPRRTVRIALWSGEEQGLLGSRFYVREHFGLLPAPTPTPVTSAAGARYKPEHARLNVYFNADSGTGAIRGVYTQGNEALRPIFRRWLLPFAQLKVGETTYTATTVTAANAGGSDFLAFDAAGLNGIDFLQDELEYNTRTWHSNQDNYDRVIPEDLKQAAVIVAAFVYNAATADAMLPRKPPRAPER
jgi:hypothetical protein